jgi:uncharacterized membrane protein YkgB
MLQLYLTQTYPTNIEAGIEQVLTFPLLPNILSDPILVAYIIFYTLDLTLAVMTSIIAFKFKNMTFTGEERTKFSTFVSYLGYGTLIMAACVILSINNIYLSLVGLLVTLHLFMVYISFSYEAFKSFRRAKEKGLEKRYRLGFLFIALMALSFVLRNIFLYIDSITAIIQGGTLGDPTAHTELYLVAWGFLIFAFIAGYFGYIWPGRKNKEQ